MSGLLVQTSLEIFLWQTSRLTPVVLT